MKVPKTVNLENDVYEKVKIVVALKKTIYYNSASLFIERAIVEKLERESTKEKTKKGK